MAFAEDSNSGEQRPREAVRSMKEPPQAQTGRPTRTRIGGHAR
jgi:hypothetical protein